MMRVAKLESKTDQSFSEHPECPVPMSSSLGGREFDLENPTLTIDIAAQQEYTLLPAPVGP